MERTSARDYGLLVLRLAGLYLALGHGWGKIAAMVTGEGARYVAVAANLGFPAPVVFAWALALAEFVGGLCIFVGFRTRVAAFFAGFAMFVATFVRHGALTRFLAYVGLGSATPEQLQALGNPERALLYLLFFVALMLLGPGRLSVDTRWQERRR